MVNTVKGKDKNGRNLYFFQYLFSCLNFFQNQIIIKNEFTNKLLKGEHEVGV